MSWMVVKNPDSNDPEMVENGFHTRHDAMIRSWALNKKNEVRYKPVPSNAY